MSAQKIGSGLVKLQLESTIKPTIREHEHGNGESGASALNARERTAGEGTAVRPVRPQSKARSSDCDST